MKITEISVITLELLWNYKFPFDLLCSYLWHCKLDTKFKDPPSHLREYILTGPISYLGLYIFKANVVTYTAEHGEKRKGNVIIDVHHLIYAAACRHICLS